MSMTEDQGATRTVGAVLAEGLARAGVKIAFTVPGESVLGLLEGLAANQIRVVAARHEGVGGLHGRGRGAADRPAGRCASRARTGRIQSGDRAARRPGRLGAGRGDRGPGPP